VRKSKGRNEQARCMAQDAQKSVCKKVSTSEGGGNGSNRAYYYRLTVTMLSDAIREKERGEGEH
jgi:hypothetical protein